jgi:hypothetical protein
MKAKEFIPASKPRNFVAKNQKTAGAGAHKDKKKAEKQGDVKHKNKFNYKQDNWSQDFERRMKNENMSERVRDPEDWDEGNTEPPNNFAVYINGKKWKVFKGKGQFADDYKERNHYRQLQNWAQAKSASTGKEWKVYVTGEQATESVEEASALEKFRKAAAEREKKHDDIEAKRQADAKQGKENMKGAIDRLEKHLSGK